MSILDKASLIQIPSGYKSTKLYSLRPSNGTGDFTFARSSSATRVNSEGLIEDVPVNKLQQSENVTATPWGAFGSSVNANTTTAPNGTNTADTILPSATTSTHGIFQQVTVSGNIYTASAYFKANGYNYACVRIATNSDTTRYGVVISLIDGTMTATDSSGSPTNTNYEIQSFGNGWYRLSVACSHSNGFIYHTVGVSNVGVPTFSNSLPNFTANGTSGIYVWGAQLNKGTTAKTYFPTTDGLNVPRLDYSGGASCASLLLEGQSTNLFTYSENFGEWSAFGGVTLTNNNTTSPEGLINATKMTSSGGLYRQDVVSANTDYVFSLFVKTDNATSVTLNYIDQSGPYRGGTITYTFSNNTAAVTGQSSNNSVTADREDYGNGWIRVILKYKTNTAKNYDYQEIRFQGGNGWVYGAQLEAGSYATSYIPTSGSTVTRTADVCNGAGTSATFNDSQGVIFAEIAALADENSDRYFSINDGSTNNRIRFGYTTPSNSVRLLVIASSVQSVDITEQLSNTSVFNKIAIKYKQNDFALWVNGVEIATDTSGNTPSGLSQLDFDNAAGGGIFYGKTKQLMVFDEALSDEELSDLTGQANLSFNNLATFYNYTIL